MALLLRFSCGIKYKKGTDFKLTCTKAPNWLYKRNVEEHEMRGVVEKLILKIFSLNVLEPLAPTVYHKYNWVIKGAWFISVSVM